MPVVFLHQRSDATEPTSGTVTRLAIESAILSGSQQAALVIWASPQAE